MTKTKLIQELRDSNRKLRTTEIEAFFSTKSDEVNAKYFNLRTEIKAQIGELENAELARIADKLERLSPELENGIASLKDKIEKLNNSIAILKAVSDVLGVTARVLAIFA